MGNIVATKCRLCSFTNEYQLGGGKYSYKSDRPVPVINKETLEFENINYIEHKKFDKLFNSDGILNGDNYFNNTINNFDLKMVYNLCSKKF